MKRSLPASRFDKLAATPGLSMGLGLSFWVPLWLLLWTAPAQAAPTPVPLTTFPAQQMSELAPLLRGADIALIESDEHGWQKQITALTLAAASPQAVRDVVIHPEKYGEFVHNMTRSAVVAQSGTPGAPGASIDHSWELSYSVISASGINHYSFLPVGPDSPAAPVEFHDPAGISHYRWEFLPAKSGGGTVVVLYGYTDVRHSGGFLGKAVAKAGSLEYGLALVTQMSMLLSMKNRAEQAPGTFAPYVPLAVGSQAPSYTFMLERGTVAMLRRQTGRLVAISLIDRSSARPDALLDAAAHPARWADFVPSISHSVLAGEQGGIPVAEVEQSLPLMSWRTQFGVRAAASSVDMLGLSGDLSGAQFRWDVRPGKSGKTELVLRANQHFDRSNLIMRELYKLEPLFEYGVGVGLDYVILKGVEGRAERQTASR